MKELLQIPGVGKKMASYLEDMGIHTLADLVGKDPQEIYEEDCRKKGEKVDLCALYVWRLAVYYAEQKVHDPEKLKWWYWKDHPYPENEDDQSVKSG